ncbi:uncharacterized protein [Centruroides vittatus]|uniref:uncharacterized protein n=1 Tax=Centruroides vittatus TaxID=120091 RepID=UPI00350FC60E
MVINESPTKKVKIMNYVEETISRYNDIDFKVHFRLKRETVEFILLNINLHKKSNTGRPSLHYSDKEKVILLSLWMLRNQESFCGIADRFGLETGHAHRLFITFCTELSKRHKQEYYCRKQFTAVILQGVCDSRKVFIDVYAGWPGSSHDARVWKNSPLYRHISNGTVSIPENCHLLGDLAYPLSSYLMVPYKDNGHLNRKEKFFNKRLSSSHVVIEQAYGDLFGRFRRLKHLHVTQRSNIPKMIISACILHNFCVLQNDEAPERDDNYIQNGNNLADYEINQDGRSKRDIIADYLVSAVRIIL